MLVQLRLILLKFWICLVILCASYLREIGVDVKWAPIIFDCPINWWCTFSRVLLLCRWRLRLLFFFIAVIGVLIRIIFILNDAQATRSHEFTVFSSQKTKLLLKIILQLQLSLFIILSLIGHDVLYLMDHLFDLSLVNLHILDNSFAEMVADFLQDAGVEVEISVLSEVTAAEGRFKGKRVLDTKLLPADDSARSLFRLMSAESAVDVREDLSLLLEHVREYSLAVSGVILSSITVHEDVLLP